MTVDIAILGGGIAGLGAAAHLAPDARVTLLEAEAALATQASGRSAAMFLEDYGNATIRALNSASLDGHRAAEVLGPRGMMMVAKATEETRFDAEAKSMGLGRLDLSQAKTLWPILGASVSLAAYREDACDLDTDRLCQIFRRTALTHGAEIRTGVRVTKITAEADKWVLEWGGGILVCNQLVNAAGAWADQIAVMAGVAPVGLQPYRRSMARIAAPGGHDVRRWPMVDAVGEQWYAKPDAGALLVSPSEEHPMAPFDAWPDDLVLAEGLDRYESYVTEAVTRPLATWAGLRTFAPDRALVIGADPYAPRFWWCAGQGGYGFQTAPAAARLLADLVLGRSCSLDAATVKALSPHRFAV